MKFEDISRTAATVSTERGLLIIQEAFSREDFLLYLHPYHKNVESIINRFMRAHAQVPGAVSEFTISSDPVGVFRVVSDGVVYEGALYINGLVMCVRGKGGTLPMLFVSKTTANLWRYPSNGIDLKTRIEMFPSSTGGARDEPEEED